MEEGGQKPVGGHLIRAVCAPLFVFSFLAAGEFLLWRWVGVSALDNPTGTVAVPVACLAAGVVYLLRLPLARWERACVVAAYVPLMAIVLWLYALYFGMLVLGIFP